MLTRPPEGLSQKAMLYRNPDLSRAHMALSFPPGGEMLILIALSSASKRTPGGPIRAVKTKALTV